MQEVICDVLFAGMPKFTFAYNLLLDPDARRFFSRRDFVDGGQPDDTSYGGLTAEVRALVERLFASTEIEELLLQVSIYQRCIILILSNLTWQNGGPDPVKLFQALYQELIGVAYFRQPAAARSAG